MYVVNGGEEGGGRGWGCCAERKVSYRDGGGKAQRELCIIVGPVKAAG